MKDMKETNNMKEIIKMKELKENEKNMNESNIFNQRINNLKSILKKTNSKNDNVKTKENNPRKKVRFKKPNRTSKRNVNNKKRGKKKKFIKKLRIMYVNLDGINDKVQSLETTANTLEADIILVTETKQMPPKLRGYGKWISKERIGKGGGGVAITAKEDIYDRLSEIKDIEIPKSQDIVWANLEIAKNKHIKLAAYYGKQETEKISIVEEEFDNLNTQINMLKDKGEMILAADFNAKLQIERNQYKQNISRNGRFLKNS